MNAKLNLASKRRSRCNLASNVDSEIPELGLDSARLNVDCEINPARIADAAVRAANTYRKYRRERRRKAQPERASSRMKRKRTRISIDSDYEKVKTHKLQPDDPEDD